MHMHTHDHHHHHSHPHHARAHIHPYHPPHTQHANTRGIMSSSGSLPGTPSSRYRTIPMGLQGTPQGSPMIVGRRLSGGSPMMNTRHLGSSPQLHGHQLRAPGDMPGTPTGQTRTLQGMYNVAPSARGNSEYTRSILGVDTEYTRSRLGVTRVTRVTPCLLRVYSVYTLCILRVTRVTSCDSE